MNSQAKTQQAERAYIAIGSNLGDSAKIIRAAMERLEKFSSAPLLKSSLWRTSPVDCPPGSPPFVNAVVGLVPLAKTPELLLEQLQAMEKEFGRHPKTVLNEARPLDLDLISFGEERRLTTHLTLPHPRAAKRRFVLQPLAEIDPALILPGQEKSVMELLRSLETEEVLVQITNSSPPAKN
ncbi:MAG: 2-amino-4-hydroxy-6-hydroxymethyldihydropteridine diphosphokinase [Verrucomicrobiota bacterium]